MSRSGVMANVLRTGRAQALRLASMSLLLLLVLLAASPAQAAPRSNQNKEVVHWQDIPGYDDFVSEVFTEVCGFEVEAEVSGWVQLIQFPHKGNGPVVNQELNIYHTRIVLTADDRTIEVLDVGPDRFYTRNGTPYLAYTGRSITGSGYIGHVVENLQTGQFEHVAGRPSGFDDVCAELAA